MESLIILALALTIDLIFGEPPAFIHPVVWLGKTISLLERISPPTGPKKQFFFGLCSLALMVSFFSLVAFILLLVVSSLGTWLYVLVSAILLKSTFSIRMLFRAADAVARPLVQNDLATARFNLRSLVSRDTSQLDEPLIAAAVIESVAENSADSFVAPLFFFAIFGVPGAVAYRAINTFDSMWGYHGRYEYLGKAAARIDDLVNLLPARLAALCLVLVSFLFGKGRQTWDSMLRYNGETESPNAGWTMSAMAGALGVRLEKVGHYKLGDAVEPVGAGKIGEAVRLTWGVILLTALVFGSLTLAIKWVMS